MGKYLEEHKEFNKLLDFLPKLEATNYHTDYKNQHYNELLWSLYFKCFLHRQLFDEAEKLFTTKPHNEVMSKNAINFCKFLLYLEKSEYEQAIGYFTEVNVAEKNTEDITEASYYYLLNYHLEKKDTDKIKETIQTLKPEKVNGYAIAILDFRL